MARRSPEQNRAIYARRSELARERGFASYGDQRKQFRQAAKSNAWHGARPTTTDPSAVEKVKAFHDAFENPANKDDYSVNGAKANWFINIVHTMTLEEWLEHYGTSGSRFGGDII